MSPAVLSFQITILATCVAASKLGPLHLLGALVGWLLFTIVFVRSTVLLFIQVPTLCAITYFLGQDIPDAMAEATIFGINIWVLLVSGVLARMVFSYLIHIPLSRFKKSQGPAVKERLGTGTLHQAIVEQERQTVEAALQATYAERGLTYVPPPTKPTAPHTPWLDASFWHRDHDGER